MIDRILKNWKTTTIGLLVLATCFMLVFVGKATLTEVGGFICGGFYVLFSKDSMLRKKEIISIVILCFCLLFCGCRKYESLTTSSKETITRDTIYIPDSIPFYIQIKGDTVFREAPGIDLDSVKEKLLEGNKLTLSPWDATTAFAYARAGVTDNIPWLNLEQRTINIDTMIYVDHIRILERQVKELESRAILKERKPFYRIIWFWIAAVFATLLFRRHE